MLLQEYLHHHHDLWSLNLAMNWRFILVEVDDLVDFGV